MTAPRGGGLRRRQRRAFGAGRCSPPQARGSTRPTGTPRRLSEQRHLLGPEAVACRPVSPQAEDRGGQEGKSSPCGQQQPWPRRRSSSLRACASLAGSDIPGGFFPRERGACARLWSPPTLGARTTRCPQGGSRTPRLSSRQACASPWPTSLQGGDGQVGWALPGGVCTRRQQTRQRTRRPQCGSRVLGQRSWCHLPRNAGSLPRLVLPASGASILAALTGRGKTHISCSSRGLGRKPCRAGQKVFFLCVKNGQALKGRAESRCSGFSPRSGAGLAQVPPSLRRNGSSHGCR